MSATGKPQGAAPTWGAWLLAPGSLCAAKFPLGPGGPRDTRDALSCLAKARAPSSCWCLLLYLLPSVQTLGPHCAPLPLSPPSPERPQLSFAWLARPPG